MRKGRLVSFLAVVTVLAACICAASASTLTITSVYLPNTGTSTGYMNMYLDTAGAGVSGYSITMAIGNPGVATVEGVKFPGWSDTSPRSLFRTSTISAGKDTVNVRLVDVGNYMNTSYPNNMYLGSIQVKAGATPGVFPVTLTVDELDDDLGEPIPVDVLAEQIDVATPRGSLVVNSTPVRGASISLNRVPRNVRTNYTFSNNIVPGNYLVNVALSGYVPQEVPVTVSSGLTTSYNFVLQRSIIITVNTVPKEATIYLTTSGVKKSYGLTNRSITDLPGGAYTITVEKEGYSTQSYGPATVRAGGSLTRTFVLQAIGENEIPPYANLTVTSTPPDAEIFVDGDKDYSLTAPGTTNIDAGAGGLSYNIYAKLAGYMTPPPRPLTVMPQTDYFVDFQLVKNPAPSSTCLWPPTNRFVDMTLKPVDGMDVVVTGITSDEATSSGRCAGEWRFAPDAVLKGGSKFQLRAERDGTGDGRVYVVSFDATERATGDKYTGSVAVCVPHSLDGRCKSPGGCMCSAGKCRTTANCMCPTSRCCCVDDGQNFDATGVN